MVEHTAEPWQWHAQGEADEFAELWSQRDELAAENAKLHAALSEKILSQTMLKDMNVVGGINMTLEGGAAQLLAEAFVDQFAESGAVNYLEMQFHSDKAGPLVVTMQRLKGKSPHQLRAEAEHQRDALLAALEPLRAKFRSGNSVPVERAMIRADEWAAVEASITEVRP